MKLINITPKKQHKEPAWLRDTFQLELSGVELLRLWGLSYSGEGGEVHSVDDRFASFIQSLLNTNEGQMNTQFEKLIRGQYPFKA